ncbi:MAG TPA: hypothetical protein VHD60_02115 [Candidatus Saccharimonadales bacterium]|nr:hypothetical protein [Candidatus Saccharimonadales bacterium]
MATSYGYHHDERLIEDVHPPGDGDGFNARQSHVQHQAIGALDDRYGRLRSFFNRASAADEAVKIPVWVRHGYTRIPPLATLELPTAAPVPQGPTAFIRTRFYLWRTWLRVQRLMEIVGAHIYQASDATRGALLATAASVGVLFASAAHVVRHPTTLVAPRKYSVGRGSYADWGTGIWARLKWAILPAALVIALFFLLIMPLERSTTKHPAAPATTQGSHSQATTPQKSTTTHSGSTSTKSSTVNHAATAPSTSTTTPAAAPALDPPVPSLSPTSLTSPVTTPLTGGGGTVTTPISSTSSSGSSPQPSPSGGKGSGSPSSGSSGPLPTTTVTVPPVSATVGGKQLLNSSGTSLTVN